MFYYIVLRKLPISPKKVTQTQKICDSCHSIPASAVQVTCPAFLQYSRRVQEASVTLNGPSEWPCHSSEEDDARKEDAQETSTTSQKERGGSAIAWPSWRSYSWKKLPETLSSLISARAGQHFVARGQLTLTILFFAHVQVPVSL